MQCCCPDHHALAVGLCSVAHHAPMVELAFTNHGGNTGIHSELNHFIYNVLYVCLVCVLRKLLQNKWCCEKSMLQTKTAFKGGMCVLAGLLDIRLFPC